MYIFQYFNEKMHNYVLFNAFVHFIIQKLKNKHTFLKTEKAKFSRFSRRENLVFSLCIVLFEESVVIFQFYQKLETNHFPKKVYKLSKAMFSRFEGTRGDKKQIFRT